jgi:hypothetical protein
MFNLHAKVLGDDIRKVLPPTTIDFLACIVTCQATYGVQQKNDRLKLYSANFPF